MTGRLTSRSGAWIVPLTGGRASVTGTAAEVGMFLDRARRDGVLLHATDLLPTGEPRMFVVTVRLAARPRPVATPPPRRRPEVVAAVVLLAASGVVGGVWMWALLALILGVAREVASAVVVAALAALLAWALLGQAGACPGLHCPGCRCGR